MNRPSGSPPTVQETLQGAAAAPGVAIGPAVCLRGHGVQVLRVPVRSHDLDREVERFRAAVRAVEVELEATESRIAETFGSDLASIFHAHSVILRDSSFARRIDQTIREDRVNAEWAVQAVADDLGEKFAQVKSQHLRERGEDLRDVTRYLLRALAGKKSSPGVGVDFDRSVVVVSHELTPDEVLRLGRRGAVGFAIEVGGANSHTAIVARALDVPLVTGIVDITNRVADDDPVIVDGEEGRFTLHPTPETLELYGVLQRRRRQKGRGPHDGSEKTAGTKPRRRRSRTARQRGDSRGVRGRAALRCGRRRSLQERVSSTSRRVRIYPRRRSTWPSSGGSSKLWRPGRSSSVRSTWAEARPLAALTSWRRRTQSSVCAASG